MAIGQVMLTLFAIVVVGYIAGKWGYMGGTFDKKLSKVVIDITCPALILSSAMTGELPDRRYILPLLGISVLTYLLLTGVALLLPRFLTKKKDDEGVIGFAMMFGNVGFMGYPIVASIFGHEAVFYAAVLNVVNTFTVFTVGTMLIVGCILCSRSECCEHFHRLHCRNYADCWKESRVIGSRKRNEPEEDA